VATLVVRSEADAFRALATLNVASDATPPSLRFEGWPKIVVTVPEGIDPLQEVRAILAIEKIVHRQYCIARYGTPDLRRLTEKDRVAAKLGVTRPDPTRLAIDFSGAATATANAVLARSASHNSSTAKDEELFGAESTSEVNREENWPRTAREVAIASIRKVSPAHVARWGLAAVIVAGISYTSPVIWRETLSHAFAMHKENNAHQLKLAELERATIVSQDRKAIGPAAQRVLEHDLQADQRRVRLLASLDFEGPFSRFVSSVEYARPALLELARASTIDINGLTLAADTAKSAAKAVRKAPPDGWKTVVRPERA
jgi:hypothetical protein